ncbi:MAG: pyridoxal phosphate-dependent decarboxylase family protein, partial [Chloroflexota bacterium]
MDRREFIEQLDANLRALDDWGESWPEFEPDESMQVPAGTVSTVMDELVSRLRENYPYHHPLYAGQMLKPPHPIAALAYATTMRINPNNHALDGGIATSKLEKEVVGDLAAMVGFPPTTLGHLTASGTIANLEALWIARSLHPEKAIVISDQSHYTHARACELLQIPYLTVGSDERGRIDLAELQELLNSEIVGTVVATAGTTGVGAVDLIHDVRTITRAAGARLHVDAAYGGFFRLIVDDEELEMPRAAFHAMKSADSIVIDPHKHGLQPYGCGAILFRDPEV